MNLFKIFQTNLKNFHHADTMGPGIKFDCTWLLKYKNLQTLWLGKKAKKNIESISQLPKLKSLSLRGIKLTDFSFLYKMNLEKLALLWNSNNNLHELAALNNLKEIELWRINKLSDISFIEELTNLEIIKLQDLKHVNCLPDLRKHANLQRLFIIDTGIDIKELPNYLQEKVSNWMIDNRFRFVEQVKLPVWRIEKNEIYLLRHINS